MELWGAEYQTFSALRTVRCRRHPWKRASPEDGPARGEPRMGSARVASACSAAAMRPERTFWRFLRAVIFALDSEAIAVAEKERDDDAPDDEATGER